VETWQPPPHNSSGGSFKAGCVLTLQPGISTAPAQQQLAGSTPQQQAWLHCVDSQGWLVGSLLQQEVLQALEVAGHMQLHQQHAQEADKQQQAAPGTAGAVANTLQDIEWQQWRAVVRSIKHGPERQVVVRLQQVS
jgi:hypothetical protein